MPEPLRPLVLAFLLLLALPACTSDDDGSMNLLASCAAAPGGSGARVFLDCAAATGNTVRVDILAADVPDEVDAYNLVLSFTPAAFRYIGFDRTSTLFTPGDCVTDAGVLCLDNLANDDANVSGQVVLGVSIVGSTMGQVITGQRTLATLMFQAVTANPSALAFLTPAVPGCVTGTTSGPALLEITNQPMCTNTVISGIMFSNSNLPLTATP